MGLAFVLLVGCTTPNKRADRAIEAYKRGDWQTALTRFSELEEDGKAKSTKRNTGTLDAMNERWHLRYHVFRGLAHWERYQSEGREDIDQLRQAYEHLQRGLELFERTDAAYLRPDEHEAAEEAFGEVRAERARLAGE